MVPESKRRFFLIAAVVLVLLFSVGLVRDLLLSREDVAVSPEAPVIIVEGLDVTRQEKGDDWHLRAERAQKNGDLSEAEDIDLFIRSKTGALWDMTAPRGTIFEVTGGVRLFQVTGHITHPSGNSTGSRPSPTGTKGIRSGCCPRASRRGTIVSSLWGAGAG